MCSRMVCSNAANRCSSHWFCSADADWLYTSGKDRSRRFCRVSILARTSSSWSSMATSVCAKSPKISRLLMPNNTVAMIVTMVFPMYSIPSVTMVQKSLSGMLPVMQWLNENSRSSPSPMLTLIQMPRAMRVTTSLPPSSEKSITVRTKNTMDQNPVIYIEMNTTPRQKALFIIENQAGQHFPFERVAASPKSGLMVESPMPTSRNPSRARMPAMKSARALFNSIQWSTAQNDSVY
mmetsp:Transcript_14131/g.38927  ORF Transcript_14131/g.38927 Transcript_14131/m.38927 type:complete len:236 (+) Transcript_14131:1314-2021(+)